MNISFRIIMICIIILISMSIAYAPEEGKLEIGDKAPPIRANDDAGNLWKLEDHLGKKYLVVYFYPAAMTGGCTKQACSYRDNKDDLSELNVEVVGVSGDPVSNLQIFKQAHNLNFVLLSDVSGDIAHRFGVPVREGNTISRTIDDKEISMERALTESRWTFIIDKTGEVIYKDTEVEAEKDSQKVLEFLKNIDK